MQKRHRIFIAINLPSDVKKRLADFEQKWPEVPAKWTPKDNLHITVLFLGDVTDEELAKTCQIVKEVALRHNSFNVALNKAAYGPQGKISFDSAQDKPPRYIWAGGEKVEEMVALKKDLEDSLFESVKFNIDKNVFIPHITLARINEWAW